MCSDHIQACLQGDTALWRPLWSRREFLLLLSSRRWHTKLRWNLCFPYLGLRVRNNMISFSSSGFRWVQSISLYVSLIDDCLLICQLCLETCRSHYVEASSLLLAQSNKYFMARVPFNSISRSIFKNNWTTGHQTLNPKIIASPKVIEQLVIKKKLQSWKLGLRSLSLRILTPHLPVLIIVYSIIHSHSNNRAKESVGLSLAICIVISA